MNPAGTVFISYTHADDAWTTKLARDLERDGFTVFFDKWDIAIGDDFIRRLDEGLSSASSGLLVMSRSTARSGWAHREYSALAQRMVSGAAKLIPVLIDDVPLPAIMSTQIFADFRSCVSETDYRNTLTQLERALRGERPVRSYDGHPIRSSPDLERRPEGPRRVTLTIGPERVSISCALGEDALPHDGPGHRVRERLWHVQRTRRLLAAAPTRPGSADPARSGSALHPLLLRLGRAMGEVFLAGPVGELLEAELTAANRQNAALRIALEVTDEADMRALPWETICLKDHDEPLTLHPQTQLYHFVSGLDSTTAIQLPGPLRVLAVIASPERGARGVPDYEAELDRIVRAVDRARREERALVRVLDWGSAAAIRAALLDERYHILHISCRAGPGVLMLETEDGDPDPVDTRRFTDEVLVPDRGLPLVVLAGSATASGPAAYSGDPVVPDLARGLLARGVPAVLAMTSDVSDRYAIQLASHFYQSLANRQAPDPLAALSDARRELERTRMALPHEDPESALAQWWAPTLYLRTLPGPLFHPDPAGAVSPARVPDRPLAGPGLGADDFVGRRGDLRALLRVLRGDQPTAVIYGIGGIGKTSLAGRLISALSEEVELVVFRRGRTTPTEILQELGRGLRPLCLKWNVGPTDELSLVAHELRDPRQDWGDQLALVKANVLPRVCVLLVLDEAEQNMHDAERGSPGDSPSELSDPELASFIAEWTALGRNARLLVTSRYQMAIADEVAARLTSHHLGPLSRAETDKLMWRLTALDALEPAERDRAYADVGGHPRALEYVDSLLRGRGARFADVAARMEAALRARGIEDPSGWLAPGPRDLGHALAEAVTLIVDDVLVDRLMARLQSFPLALRLFVAASVFRAPVDAMGLNWAVAKSLAPGPDAARDARIARASEQLEAAQEAGSAFTLEQLELPAALLAQLKRDCAAGGRPQERAGLDRAIEALLAMSLLARVPDSPADDPQYLVHRWTARGLRSLVRAGLAGLVEPAELTQAHLRAAAYYEWRADIWPDAVADLLEARHHYHEAGERAAAAAVSMRAAPILFRLGAFSHLRRLCEQTRGEVGSAEGESCELLYWQSRAAQAQGELDSAERLCREALALAGQLGATRWLAVCYEHLASITREAGHYEPARGVYQAAIDLARDLRDRVLQARCYQGFGAVALATGDDDEARRYSLGALNLCSPAELERQRKVMTGRRQLLELARARGDSGTAAHLVRDGFGQADDLEQIAGRTWLQVGKVALRRDDLDGAETAFENARRIAELSRDLVMRKDCYLQLGLTFQRRGALAQARALFEQYLGLADNMGDRPGTVGCLHQMGELAEAHGDWEDAAGWHEQALSLAEGLGQPHLVAEAHVRMAQTSVARGDTGAAEASYRRAAEIGEQTRDPQIMLSSRLGLAELRLLSGQQDEAEDIYRDGRKIALQHHDQVGVTRCQMGLATVARRRGDYDDASFLFTKAYDNADAMGNQAMASACLLELGVTAAEDLQLAAAAAYYRQALPIAQRLKDGRKIAELYRRLADVTPGPWARLEWYQAAAKTYEAYGYQLSAARLWLEAGRFAAGFDLDEATRCCRRALDLVGQDKQFPVAIEAWLELARCSRQRGEHGDARDAASRAVELAEGARRDDLVGQACQEGGLVSQLAGDPAGAQELHRRALDLAERTSDRDTVIASCRDLGRLARWEHDEEHGSLEYWYGRARDLAEQAGDEQTVTACAQQLLLAAIRAGDAQRAAELIAERPALVGHLDENAPAESGLARRRGELGAELTTQGRPDEALGFTAASLLAWLVIDHQQAERQRGWLSRQRAELGDERFARLLAEHVDDGELRTSLLEISVPATGPPPGDDGAASADVDHDEADGRDGAHNGQ